MSTSYNVGGEGYYMVYENIPTHVRMIAVSTQKR
jgi:hypothetical protein